MRVVRDEPGHVLMLEGDEGTAFPAALSGVVGSVLSMVAPGAAERVWYPARLAADRTAGTFEIVEKNRATGEERRQSVRLDHVISLHVQKSRWAPTYNHPHPTPGAMDVSLRLEDASPARPRSLRVLVEAIDTHAEIADFAYRLGAAMGLGHERRLRCDPRRIELEITRAAGPGTNPIPPLPSANYDLDVIAPDARRADDEAEEIFPPFQPEEWRGDHRLTRWIPGQEVRFVRALRRIALGCLPILVGGLAAGPLALLFSTLPLGIILIYTGFGVGSAYLALPVVVKNVPRQVVIAWDERTLIVTGWLGRRRVPFSQITSIELRCFHRTHQVRRSHTVNLYRCEVLAHARDDATRPIVLASTHEHEEDAEAPYDLAFPLATDLARTLGVTRRVSDYP